MNEAKCFKILENKNSHTTSYSMLKSNLQLQYLHFQLVIFCIQLATLTKLSCLLWHQNRFGSKIIYPLPVTDIWHFRLRRWKCISVWHTINLFIKWYFIRSTVAQIYKIVFSKEIIFFKKLDYLGFQISQKQSKLTIWKGLFWFLKHCASQICMTVLMIKIHMKFCIQCCQLSVRTKGFF